MPDERNIMRVFDYSRFAEECWDSEILRLVAKIHECKGRQELFIRQKPAELDRLVEIARIQSTEASNKIEGIVTTSTRMHQLINEKTQPRNRDEQEILGYRNVLKTIHENYEYIPVRSSYILQLHRDLLEPAGLEFGGRFKNVQNYIAETLADGTRKVRFTPVEPFETPQAVEDLCESFSRAMALEYVDPLILIPVFICDFLCIHPFNDGNGRMSRLMTLLLLYKSGFTVGKYISIEREIEKTKETYYEVLEQSNYDWYENRNDYRPFIKYMLKIILVSYNEFEKRVGLMNDIGVKSSAYDVVKVYVDNKTGKFTGSDVISNCPLYGRSSVLSALKKLTEEQVIVKSGVGRSTYYIRNILQDKGKDIDK